MLCHAFESQRGLKTIKRKIGNYERANFSKYRLLLYEYDLINNLESDTNIDSNVNITTKAICEGSEKAVPNKAVTIRPNDHPWITCNIRPDS